jgi:imidazolonepropionase-like amidohydrolase
MKKQNYIRLILLVQGFILFHLTLFSQVPSPGKPPAKPLLILNTTIHCGNGKVLEKGCLLMSKGKILAVEPSENLEKIRNLAPGAETLNLSGQHLYPGFILLNTTLGLNEVDAVRATVDKSETGNENPNVNALSAYNTDSDIIPTIRSNGILLAQITPSGHCVRGMSSVVQLDAWNWEDAAVKQRDGLHISWPSKYENSGWWAEPGQGILKNKDSGKEAEAMETLFAEAKVYNSGRPRTINTRLEALRSVFSGETRVYFHAYFPADMVAALQFAKRMGIPKVALVTDYHVAGVLDLVKERNIPLVIKRLHSLPTNPEDGVFSNLEICKTLLDKGILFTVDYEGDMDSRNLGFMAGALVRFGFSKEKALQLITENAARILGIEKNFGTLEAGKDATFFVSSGDALDMKTQNISRAWIQGRPVSMESKQTALYEKFKKMLEEGR